MNISFPLTDFPLIHSVANELDAMAEPQPNVLNLASVMFPLSSTSIFRENKKKIIGLS
jgi:hypothetical protein